MIIIRGKYGKSIEIEKIVTSENFEKPESESLIFKKRSDYWYSLYYLSDNLWVALMEDNWTIDNLRTTFFNWANKGDVNAVNVNTIIFYLNVEPERIPEFEALEKEFGVECILSVKDDCNVYVYRIGNNRDNNEQI